MDQHVANRCPSPGADGLEIRRHRRQCQPQTSHGPGGGIQHQPEGTRGRRSHLLLQKQRNDNIKIKHDISVSFIASEWNSFAEPDLSGLFVSCLFATVWFYHIQWTYRFIFVFWLCAEGNAGVSLCWRSWTQPDWWKSPLSHRHALVRNQPSLLFIFKTIAVVILVMLFIWPILIISNRNPALEDQACDRIYRVGQRKDVTIHR